MQMIDDLHDALAVLHDPAFVVPPVPPATAGVAWLRSTVGRFSTGEAHTRRRALSESLLSTVDPVALREAAASSPHAHPVQLLAAALGLDSSPRTTDAVRAVAAAYQPGTGDEAAADLAVRVLIDTFGGTPDELIAARIGVLVQACDATATLIDRARTTDLETALRDTPPVPATKRMATRSTDLNAAHAAADHPRSGRVEAGEVVRVSLRGIPFGAGPRGCPGRTHALALAEGALRGSSGAAVGGVGVGGVGVSGAAVDGVGVGGVGVGGVGVGGVGVGGVGVGGVGVSGAVVGGVGVGGVGVGGVGVDGVAVDSAAAGGSAVDGAVVDGGDVR
ncbi:hypothetical protein ACFPIJ_20935 [Dactylosporangium cerinum]|uniref:Cytochrome P450 n=1 Tax=Dactylosporangium cerinum TaxID=1434730 RepID=A0ABV9VY18_9ACTN